MKLKYGRAFLQMSAIVSLGKTVYTPWGRGVVRSKAVLPFAAETSTEPRLRRTASTAGEIVHPSAPVHSHPLNCFGPMTDRAIEEVKHRYTIDLHWGTAFIRPSQVHLNPLSVPPSVRPHETTYEKPDLIFDQPEPTDSGFDDSSSTSSEGGTYRLSVATSATPSSVDLHHQQES